jgi:hypothetical protein
VANTKILMKMEIACQSLRAETPSRKDSKSVMMEMWRAAMVVTLIVWLKMVTHVPMMFAVMWMSVLRSHIRAMRMLLASTL